MKSVRRKKALPGNPTPAWMVTFADLTTLMLTFFILLLSFAEMDIEKYRAMASSMAGAFGSGIFPGEGASAPIPVLDRDAVTLPPPSASTVRIPEFIDERDDAEAVTKIPGGVIDLASHLIGELQPEVADKSLNVSYDDKQVVIRFSEEATFRSGEADIKPEMIPIIERVVRVMSACTGDVIVSGYTDDRPISSERYRSNWDLSAARAVSVVHELTMNRQVPAERVVAAGRAETNPLVPNDSPENRALNRRVEIAILNPVCDDTLPTAELPVEILP